MNLIQQEKDLQSFSDQALLQEAMQPTRGYAPYMVQTEIARRTQERDAYRKQMMAQEAQSATPIAQQNVDRFVAQNMAAMQQPAMPQSEMMPQAQGIASMAAPQMGSAMVDQALADAQAAEGIGPLMAQGGMPVQGMSEGGGVYRMQTGTRVPSFASRNEYESWLNSNAEVQRILRKSPVFRTPEENQILSSAGMELNRRKITGELKIPGVETLMKVLDPSGITGITGTVYTPPAVPREPTPTESTAPGITSTVAPQDFSSMLERARLDPFGRRISQDVVTVDTRRFEKPPGTKTDEVSAAVVPAVAPAAAPAAVAPAAAAPDTYWADLLKEMQGLTPSKEEFQKGRQAALLANLGALIGGATRRGDIAAGLGQLVGQQLAAQKEFKKEEREALRDILALRGQQRAETRADVIRREDIARQERQFKMELDAKLQQIEVQRAEVRANAEARMAAAKNDAERLAIARDTANREMPLNESRRQLLEAQAEYYRNYKGDRPFSGSTPSSAAELESGGL